MTMYFKALDTIEGQVQILTKTRLMGFLGDLSIQGNIKAVRSLPEPLQMAMDNGARRALIQNKRHFLEVSAHIVNGLIPFSMVIL